MSELRQGDVRWTEMPDPYGRRPVVILTRTDAVGHLTNVTVAPLTRTVGETDSEIILSPEQGVPTVCAVSLDNIMTILKAAVGRRITKLDVATMNDVFRAIRFVFAMP